jgi:hypothetical protein
MACDQELLAVLAHLKENKDLVELDLIHDFRISRNVGRNLRFSQDTSDSQILNLMPIWMAGEAPLASGDQLPDAGTRGHEVNVSLHRLWRTLAANDFSSVGHFLPPGRIGSGAHPCHRDSLVRIVPRWGEGLLALVPIPIAFGCF